MTMTMRVNAILMAGALLFAAPAFAQYKYVEPNGRTTYSDQPAPASAGVVTQTKLNGRAAPVVPLPFGLQQAVSKYPVTLYTGEHCGPCDDARAFLRSRGVPFVEKTVTSDDDIALFKQQSPEGTAPVIAVGARRTIGFTQSTMSSLLDSAGYPATSILPRDYEMPAPTPLSPSTKAPTTALAQPGAQGAGANTGANTGANAGANAGSTANSSASATPQGRSAPPGFRF